MAGILQIERCFSSKKQEEIEEDSKMYKSYAEITSSLPFREAWGSKLVLYKGFWIFDDLLPGVMAFQDHFKARKTDIFVTSIPKAGTTWTKALTFAILTRDVNHPSSPTHPLLKLNPHSCVTQLEFLYMGIENMMPNTDVLDESLRLFATHVPYSLLPKSIMESRCKIINVSRDPKGTLISHREYLNNLRERTLARYLHLEECVDLFASGISLCGPEWVYRSEFSNAASSNSNILLLNYEEMMEKPVENVKKIAEFLGYGFTEDEEKQRIVDEIIELCSFNNLKNLDVNKNGTFSAKLTVVSNKHFFRKGEVGDWANYLTPEMANKLDSVGK